MPESFSSLEKKNSLKILNELKKNARMSNEEISRRVGLSRPTVSKLINKMEKANWIWGYAPVLDYEKIGLRLYLVLIKLKPSSKSAEFGIKALQEDLLLDLKKEGFEFTFSSYLNGKYEWVFVFDAENLFEAKKIIQLVKKEFETDLFEEINLHEVMIPIRYCGILSPELNEKLKEIL